jgi:hypothetical protein
MARADFYRQQADLLRAWGAAANDPVVKEQLRKRAEDYMTLAARLEQQQAEAQPPHRPQVDKAD